MVHITATGYLPAEVNGGATTTPSAPNTTVLSSPIQTTKTSGDLTMATKGGQQVSIHNIIDFVYSYTYCN